MTVFKKRYFSLMAVIATGLALTFAVAFRSYHTYLGKMKISFEEHAAEQTNILRESIQNSLEVLDAINAFYDASEQVDREEFHLFTSNLIKKNAFIKSLQWSAATQTDRGPEFPVIYVEPQASKERDILQYADEASVSTDVFIAPPVKMESGSQGLMALKPVLGSDRNLRGFIVAVYDIEELLNEVFRNETSHRIELAVFDAADQSNQGLTYSSNPQAKNKNQFMSGLHFRETLDIGGRIWQVYARPKNNSKKAIYVELVFILMTGLALTYLLSNYLFVKVLREEKIEDEVRRRTAELIETQELLKQRVMESQLIHQATFTVAQALTLDDALRKCMTSVCEVMACPLGHIYLPKPDDKNTLFPSDIWYCKDISLHSSFIEVTMKTQFQKGVGLPGRVLETLASEWITDLTKDDNFLRAQVCHDIHIKGAFAFPIAVSGEILAVLEFFHSEPMVVKDEFLRAIKNVSEQVSRVLENKKAEAQLKTERDRLKIFQNVTVSRELEMIELKKENNELCRQLGRIPPHDLSFLAKERRDVSA